MAMQFLHNNDEEEDDEDEDVDVKSLRLLLEQSKGYYKEA
jgi:hypothetical protein